MYRQDPRTVPTLVDTAHAIDKMVGNIELTKEEHELLARAKRYAVGQMVVVVTEQDPRALDHPDMYNAIMQMVSGFQSAWHQVAHTAARERCRTSAMQFVDDVRAVSTANRKLVAKNPQMDAATKKALLRKAQVAEQHARQCAERRPGAWGMEFVRVRKERLQFIVDLTKSQDFADYLRKEFAEAGH